MLGTKTITIFKDEKVTIDFLGCDNHAKKNVNVYVENLIRATLKIDYNMISGGNSFNVSFNNHKVIDDVYCGWGGCKDTVEADVTNCLVNGTNTFDLYFFKAPFCHPGNKDMVFSAYLIIEYEGQPPEQPKRMNVVLLQGKRIDLTQMDSKKDCKVIVNALWDESKTKILSSKLRTTWEVNVSQMACDFYWNGEKVIDYYCGWGQCHESKESAVQLIKGVNDLYVEVYKPVWHPWATTTIVTAILDITYVGDKPIVKIVPPLPDWVTWVKYGAIAAGCALGGYVITKSMKGGEEGEVRHEGRR